MKSHLPKLLSSVAILGIAASAYSLTIIPTFDGSITNDLNGAAMQTAIQHAISVLQSNFTDNVTVKIHFTNDPSVGLGQSSTWGNEYSYATFLTALKSRASSVNDANGLSKLPDSLTDPLVGASLIWINKAPARRLGLTSSSGPDGFDSTVSLKMSLMNFTRPPGDPNKFDLAQVAEHEMNEVLGCSSDLPDLTEISPIDLFRYTANLVRSYTTSGDDAYFSVDGTNLLARFNMNSGGDYADWYSYDANWAPNGGTPKAQVQDAFSGAGNAMDNGSNELTMLDVVGWTVAVAGPTTLPSIKIFTSGVNQLTLSWTNTASGFTLQERTDLNSGGWVASSTGTTNPAVIVSTTGQKFYRLYKAAAPAGGQAKTAALDLSMSPDRLKIRALQPLQP